MSHDPLFGQSAPLSSDGHGATMLFWCPDHHGPWLRDGTHVTDTFVPGELVSVAERLHADLDHLPPAHCPRCTRATIGGELTCDEYQLDDEIGYGLSWEGDAPVGTHLMVLVLPLAIAQAAPPAQPCFHPDQFRAWLSWLATIRTPDVALPLPPGLGASLFPVPPGHHAPGTEQFVWQGGLFSAYCPPLHGPVSCLIAQAMPPQEPYTFTLSLSLARAVATLGLRLSHS